MTDDIDDAPAPDMPEGEQLTAAAAEAAAPLRGGGEPHHGPGARRGPCRGSPGSRRLPAAAAGRGSPPRPRLPAPAPAEAVPAAAPAEDVPAGRLSAEDFAAAVERTVVEFSEGSLVSGTVVRVDPDEVLVDIGFKSEGIIPVSELSIRNNVNPSEVVQVGDKIEALVLQVEDQEGRLILSKKRAQYERAWGRIEEIMRQGGTVTGQVIEVVKGGLIVDIGLRGFLPASLVELRRVRDLQPYVGTALEAKVIELDKNRNNVVLSRRAYLEEEQAEQRQAFLDALAPGEIRSGVVSSVVNFGAFVDLGGMDGLVHVSELSWQHVSHPGRGGVGGRQGHRQGARGRPRSGAHLALHAPDP